MRIILTDSAPAVAAQARKLAEQNKRLQKAYLQVRAQLDRATSEAGELTAILNQVDRRVPFIAKHLPETARGLRELCTQGKRYTCGSDFLARLRRAENAVAAIRVIKNN
jgi:DNA repair ATPase RecN